MSEELCFSSPWKNIVIRDKEYRIEVKSDRDDRDREKDKWGKCRTNARLVVALNRDVVSAGHKTAGSIEMPGNLLLLVSSGADLPAAPIHLSFESTIRPGSRTLSGCHSSTQYYRAREQIISGHFARIDREISLQS